MIQPIIAAQSSTPVSAIQRSQEGQNFQQNYNASSNLKEDARQQLETVVDKDQAAYYEHNFDAREEGKNKYENLYTNKKKNTKSGNKDEKQSVTRENFDIKI